jgi:hypothetical protein
LPSTKVLAGIVLDGEIAPGKELLSHQVDHGCLTIGCPDVEMNIDITENTA